MLLDYKSERNVTTHLLFVVVVVAFLPTKHLGVLMDSFKRVRAFQIELEFESVGC